MTERKEERQDAAKRPSIFRRKLPVPPALGSFTSEVGRKLFSEALCAGTMEVYFDLAEQFRTQDEPAFCGISTLVMVLNTLQIDPGIIWKGEIQF